MLRPTPALVPLSLLPVVAEAIDVRFTSTYTVDPPPDNPADMDCGEKTRTGQSKAYPADGPAVGMPAADIVAAWTAPFESEDPSRGGCPAV